MPFFIDTRDITPEAPKPAVGEKKQKKSTTLGVVRRYEELLLR
jgi:hypothetical protein